MRPHRSPRFLYTSPSIQLEKRSNVTETSKEGPSGLSFLRCSFPESSWTACC